MPKVKKPSIKGIKKIKPKAPKMGKKLGIKKPKVSGLMDSGGLGIPMPDMMKTKKPKGY